MAKQPTATNDKPADVMPEIDADDGIDHAAGAGVVDQGTGQDEGGRQDQRHEIQTQDPFEDARTAAVRAYRAKRDAEAAAQKGQQIPGKFMQVGQVLTGQDAPNGEEVEHGRLIMEGEEPPADEPPAGEEPPAPAAAAQQQPAAQPGTPPAPNAPPAQFGDDTEIPLVIDGRVVTKKLSEIVRHAQRDLSADNRLEEARRLLTEARAAGAAPTPSQGDDGANSGDRRPAASSSQPDNPGDEEPIDADAARALARKIQVGDEEEGAQALVELVKTIAKRTPATPAADQIRQATRQELQALEAKREITTAIEKFATNYPTIVADADLTEVARTRVKAELQADLKAAGVDDETLASMKDDTNALVGMHRNLRMQGARVRDYGTLLDNVGSYLNNKFGRAPAPTPPPPPQNSQTRTGQPPLNDPRLQQRQDMKRNAPLQPRAAGVRGPTQQMQAKPKSKADIVAEMRRNRGFTH